MRVMLDINILISALLFPLRKLLFLSYNATLNINIKLSFI